MKFKSALLVLICVKFCYVYSVNTTKEEFKRFNEKEEEARVKKYGEVVFANLLYRHGDRTPIHFYPNDPNKHSDKWKIGPGQLRQEGCLRHYKLGEWIRDNYNNLLSTEYNYKDIYVLSSDSDRCIMSAQCNLAGIYRLNDTSGKPPFQPIPIHTKPQHIDKMIMLNASCATYDAEVEHALYSPTSHYNIKYKQLFENLTKHTGMHVGDINEVSEIYDNIKVEKEHGLEVPEWTMSYFPEPLYTVSKDSFLSRTTTNFMKRIKGGPLLTDMLNHLTLKANGTLTPDRKLWIYSGHDDTLITLLDTLHLLKEPVQLPSYATMLALQLRRKDNLHYVTILYKDGNEEHPKELYMDGCNGQACTLEMFINITKKYTITDEEWENECAVDTRWHQNITTKSIIIVWPVMLIMVIGMGCFLYIYIKYIRKRNTKYYYKLKMDAY